MGYRREVKNLSPWPGSPEQSLKVLQEIGIPEQALDSHKHFKQFLTDGSIPGSDFTISDMDDESYFKLFDILTSWYDMDASEFTASEKRRTRDWHESG